MLLAVTLLICGQNVSQAGTKLPFGLDLEEITALARQPSRLPFGLELAEVEKAARIVAVK